MPHPKEMPHYLRELEYSEEGQQISVFLHGFIAKTMHGVVKPAVLDIQTLGVKNNDIVIYHFGCCDIYSKHVENQSAKRGVEEVLNTLSENYVQWIIDAASNYQDLISVVMCVLFPWHAKNSKYTTLLNEKLQQLCHKNNIHFLDVYDFYLGENGGLNLNLSNFGDHHVGVDHNYYIRRKLLGLLKASGWMGLRTSANNGL